jgi:hypothetical protein
MPIIDQGGQVTLAIRRWLGIGALTLAAFLTLTVAAHALSSRTLKRAAAPAAPRLQTKARSGQSGPYPSTGFRLQASNGYRIFVVGLPGRTAARHDIVGLRAETDGAFSTYIVRGNVTSKTIKAQIGGLGTIDMSFHRTRGIHHVRPRCAKHPYKVKAGVWRGSIDFTGESGYTTVSATEAKPTWLYGPASCGSVRGSTTGAWLNNSGRDTHFEAYQNGGPGTRTDFNATVYHSSKRMGIVREVWTHGPADAFTYNGKLTKARVTPPAPFSGSATYRRSGRYGKGTMNGDLSATFPGGSTASLVTRKNAAHFQHAEVREVH